MKRSCKINKNISKARQDELLLKIYEDNLKRYNENTAKMLKEKKIELFKSELIRKKTKEFRIE